MSIIDTILSEIDKRVEFRNEWHVEILAACQQDDGLQKESYLWNAQSPVAAKAIKEYLIAMGMTDGVATEPQGSYIRISRRRNQS